LRCKRIQALPPSNRASEEIGNSLGDSGERATEVPGLMLYRRTAPTIPNPSTCNFKSSFACMPRGYRRLLRTHQQSLCICLRLAGLARGADLRQQRYVTGGKSRPRCHQGFGDRLRQGPESYCDRGSGSGCGGVEEDGRSRTWVGYLNSKCPAKHECNHSDERLKIALLHSA
jgi:hypothetical protein